MVEMVLKLVNRYIFLRTTSDVSSCSSGSRVQSWVQVGGKEEEGM